ncbi:ATP-grasp domain-containing protein [Streptomyces sp. P9(2023)]|uniref:ATP-grasp domain-containing protein n=1 Tax=Streptomyces sp. P9(2023) TaxID=3064394 RepID=UPI0028F42063|nr:ATP-grasp domain-containing protein [Streptomyces sp. P9(2023)]MDT9687040.1 ATP-grasp domain-containing protein [Streptomyces sp. P9(2023)]
MTPLDEEKPLLLVITSGLRRYREYLLRSIATRYRVHLIDSVAPTWELPYLAGSTVVPDTGERSVSAAARRIAAEQPVAGVMSWHEEHIVQAALVAEELGLPGTRATAVRRCRDKFETRTALAAAGLPQPAFALVGTVAEALSAAGRLGYPVVLKPRAAGGSQGVVLVRDAAELADQFEATRDVPVPHAPDFDRVVLVEEYLAGPEISVDSVVHEGRVTPVFVGRKEVGFPPYFEETGHRVSGADPLLTDPELLRTLTDIHGALGCTDGWTHAELKLTPEGPKLIEVNGRLGGDLIPYLGLRATGIDPGLAAADVACGVAPDVAPSVAAFAGVRFFYPRENDTLIASVAFDPEGLPAELDLLDPLVGPGDVVSPPRKGLIDGRIALATAVAETDADCEAALAHAERALRLTVGGATGATGSVPSPRPPAAERPSLRILVLHRIPDSFVRYAENIDHDAHDVTYVSAVDRTATLPADVKARRLERPGIGDTVAEVLASVAGLPTPDVVIALSEYDLIPAARIREALGVPGPRPDDVLPARDKVVMKAAVAAAGLRTPRYAPLLKALSQGADALPWSGRTVLKPVAGASSEGVTTYSTAAAALDAVRGAEPGIDIGSLEVEEFVTGPIIHVDGLVAAGEPIVVQASRYVGTCLGYAEGRPLGSVQIDTPPETVDWTLACLRAVGIHDGPFHLEAIETDEGPVFLEVGARVGGADVVDTFALATGVHMPSAQVRLIVDGAAERPEVRTPEPDERYGWFVVPGHTLGSRYCRITGEEPFRQDPVVQRWVQRGADEPIKTTITYADADVPVAGVVGPAPAAVLERFLTEFFASVRVEPTEDPR